MNDEHDAIMGILREMADRIDVIHHDPYARTGALLELVRRSYEKGYEDGIALAVRVADQ